MPSRTLRTLNLGAAAARPSLTARTPTATRAFTNAAARRYAYKDTQDRESLNPSGTEGTKSRRDSEVAHEKGAFDPSTTRPGAEKREADGGALDVSGANQAASKPQGDKPHGGGGGGEEVRKGGRSGGGGGAKDGKN
ncbi:hypothetical protein CSHISOI_07030 [Colletotrichum shisoi]|uniref:Uncharacterized protein n=1 Tax=Colletotrichum shisoi TaxID=2078593 RepID=A0A5Q4BNX5_9PEZI|nr:hypothetical protein CSHISOI_07030 [Colletotrichum shisoi]